MTVVSFGHRSCPLHPSALPGKHKKTGDEAEMLAAARGHRGSTAGEGEEPTAWLERVGRGANGFALGGVKGF